MASEAGFRKLPQIPDVCRIASEDIDLLGKGQHPNPAAVLGLQVSEQTIIVRCWISGAKHVSLASDLLLPESPDAKEDAPIEVSLQQVLGLPLDCQWLFEAAFLIENVPDALKWNYELRVKYSDDSAAQARRDPYSLGDLLPDMVLRGWASGNPEEPPAATFGAHHMELRSIEPGLWGTRFAVWAPHARAVNLVGDFNFWDTRAHPMCHRRDFGVWELFLPTWDLRGQKYGYQIVPASGEAVIKTDPFALEFVEPANGGHDAKIPTFDDYSRSAWSGDWAWSDSSWLQHRKTIFGHDAWSSQPLSIYEVHLESWTKSDKQTYRTLAEPLAKYVAEMGFTAVELLPLSQYPSDASWGYQCAAGLFAVDSRLGSPDDFRYLVDTLHKHSLAVFIDFVGAHFAKDTWGLVRYSGAPQFEYEGDLGELPGWGTARFNYAKPEVQCYLLGAVEHWLNHFHIDGLRVDAVAAMVYRNFGREEDGDAILAGKGVINTDGVAFLRRLCKRVRDEHPGVLLAAEESTNFKWVTSRAAVHGTERHGMQLQDLGFHLKWNMGFTYDALAYFASEAAKRPHMETFGCKKLAWYLVYAFNERWVLPFSHDNSHHSLLEEMGEKDLKSQSASLRVLMMYTIGMPGRPLFFMGSEIGEAWYQRSIAWEAAEKEPGKQLICWMKQLLHHYRQLPALHQEDDEPESFEWIDKDSASQCIYAWKRKAKGAQDVIVVVNASNALHPDYRLSAAPGKWRCLASTSYDGCSRTDMEVDVAPETPLFAVDLAAYSAQLWVAPHLESSGGYASKTSKAGWIDFEVKHPGIPESHALLVVGACPGLGNWQPSAGVTLTSSESCPSWTASVDVSSAGPEVEFKLIMVSPDAAVTWEPFAGNRRAKLSQTGAVQVSAVFGRI